MEQFKNKLVSKLQNTKFLKELREFDSLIKAIGECKSKSEEDRIILAEIEILKQRLADPKIDKSRGKEYMVRLIYCEMLGHDTSWAYVKALQLASEPNILTKKAAYLALTQFFDQNHELVLLLVNTLLSDLKSDNFINVGTALVVCTKLIGPDLINAVYPLVVDRLKHPKEHVRKKAIMVLHRFHQLDPRREGALSGLEVDKHFRTMLCDKDPGVMSAALCALHDVIKVNPQPYKNLIPSFTSILKQVSEHRLPKSYDYHRVPAPFIQIKLLKILALLGAGDRAASENMYAVVQQALRRATSSHNIGNAIIFECITTITTLFPNQHLLSAAAESVATFLRSPVHNLRYVGVDALAGIIRINPQAAQDHQLAVVDCLEDPDDTLKLKTLDLLYRMTKAANVEVIVERMLSYLRTVTDEHIKRDITRKVSELAERYAPAPAWFIRVVSEVCELAGQHMEPAMAHSLTKLIAEQDTELHRSAVEQYAKLLDVPMGRNLPDVLLQIMIWTLGEYGSLLSSSTGPNSLSAQQLQSKLVSLVTRQKCSDVVRELLPPALAKISVQAKVPLAGDAEAWLTKAGNSQSVELQQRAYEALALLTAPPAVQSAVLPFDASCEEIDTQEMSQLRELAFLNWYVEKALQAGASPYAPQRHVTPSVGALDTHHKHVASGGSGLRFEAYEAAPTPPATTKSGASSIYDFGLGSTPTATQPTMQTAAPVSNEPQLLAAASKQGPRWGPAQFETAPTSIPAAAPAAKAPAASAKDLLGDFGSDVGGSSGRGTPKSAAARQAQSDRDRLAASLFAGLGGTATSRHSATTSPAPAPKPAAPAPAIDLLSLDDVLPSQPAPTTAPAGGLDLLMDLSSPAPAQSTAQPVTNNNGFDSLLGDFSSIGSSSTLASVPLQPTTGLPTGATGGPPFGGVNSMLGSGFTTQQGPGNAGFGMGLGTGASLQPGLGSGYTQAGMSFGGLAGAGVQQQFQKQPLQQQGQAGLGIGLQQPTIAGSTNVRNVNSMFSGMGAPMQPSAAQKTAAVNDPFADLL